MDCIPDPPRADEGVAASLADGVVVHDADGVITSFNDSALRLLGLSADQLTGRTPTDPRWHVLHEDGTEWPGDSHPVAIALETGRPVLNAIMGVDRPADTRAWLTIDAVPTLVRTENPDPLEREQVAHVVVSFSDVTRELEMRNQLLSVFEGAVIGICVTDLDTRFERVNPALCQILDRAKHEIVGHTWNEFVHPEDRDRVRTELRPLVERRLGSVTTDLRLLRPDGSVVWARASHGLLHYADDTTDSLVCQIEDVTGQTAAAEQLRWLAFHDALTGLPNRSLLVDRIEHALARASRTGTLVGALFLDVDRFKLINDTMGHAVGDRLLTEVANRLRAACREDDTVARLGGDEFVVLAEGLHEAHEITRVARRVQRTFDVPMDVGARTLPVRVSIGMAIGDDSGPSGPENLLRDADTALYRAKERGRNRYELFDESLRLEAVRRLTTEEILRTALEEDGLAVHYQPVVDLTTSTLVGVEALLRLKGPDGQLQSPGDFIEIAEESGLIVQIGAGVLDMSCAQLADWRRRHGAHAPRHVAVNVSARQLSLPSFVPLVERILRVHDLVPQDLILEFTESVIVEADEQTTESVRALHRLGVTLAVDDFGTGYSSLSYLKRFPVGIVKLDRTFVNGFGEDPSDTAIVEAVLALGRALGLSVTAEGIETPEQLRALRELGCDHGQGYLLARPCGPEDLDALIESPSWTRLLHEARV